MKRETKSYLLTTYKLFAYLPALFLTGINIHVLYTFGFNDFFTLDRVIGLLLLFSHFLLAHLIIKGETTSLIYALILIVFYDIYIYINQDNSLLSVRDSIILFSGYYLFIIIVGIILKHHLNTHNSNS